MRRLLSSLVLGGLLMQPAAAAEIAADRNADGSYGIRIFGHIVPEDVPIFAAAAAQIPEGSKVEVTLTSYGGTLRALEIGRIIRKRKFRTMAMDHCASICASIWLAGVPRVIYGGTLIGFHAVGEHCVEHICSQVSPAGNALVGAYLNELGFDAKAIWYFTNADIKSMTWLTADKAKLINLSYMKYDMTTGTMEQHQ